MKLRKVLKTLRLTFLQVKSRATLSWLKRRFRIIIERFSGLDYSSTIKQKKLGLSASMVNLGSPSSKETLREIFENVEIKNSDRILDIGCAKGFAINYFLDLPFARVAGLEISDTLISICKRNIQRQHGLQVDLFHADATTFNGYGDYNYFYLYNPFPSREILEKVVAQITCYTAGKIFVIYNNPVNSEVFTEQGFLLEKRLDDPKSMNKQIFIFSKQ